MRVRSSALMGAWAQRLSLVSGTVPLSDGAPKTIGIDRDILASDPASVLQSLLEYTDNRCELAG